MPSKLVLLGIYYEKVINKSITWYRRLLFLLCVSFVLYLMILVYDWEMSKEWLGSEVFWNKLWINCKHFRSEIYAGYKSVFIFFCTECIIEITIHLYSLNIWKIDVERKSCNVYFFRKVLTLCVIYDIIYTIKTTLA